jgi:hypothetical protein
MIWLLIASGLAFLAGALAMVFDRPRWTRILVITPALAAALIMVGLLVEAPGAPDGPYGATRLSLDALMFSPKPDQPIRIGGDAMSDDVVLSPGSGAAAWRIGRGRLPRDFLQIRRVSPDAVEFQVMPQSGPGSRAVIAVGDRPETFRYLGAVPAPAAARPCKAACASTAPTLAEAKKAKVFSAGVYDVVEPGKGALRPAGGFFFTPLSDAKLMQAGVPGPVSRYRLNAGEKVKVALYEAVASTPGLAGAEPDAGPLIARRSFEAALDKNGVLTLRLDTPQTQILDLQGGAGGRPAVRIGSGSAGDEPSGAGETVATFSLLGRVFDPDLTQIRLDVPRASTGETIVHERDGSERRAIGPTPLGGEHRIVVGVQPLDFLSGVFPFLWISAVIALAGSFFASRRLRLDDPIAALTIGATEMLLAMRLLIATEGAFVDESPKAQAAVAGALIALPLGALIVICAHPRAREQRFGLACLMVVTLATAALAYATTGRFGDVTILAGLGVAGCALRLYAPQAWFDRARTIVMGPLGRVRAKVGATASGVGARLASALAAPQDSPLIVGLGGGLVLLALRAGFLVIGHAESIQIVGVRVALSLLFTPLTLIFAAPLMAGALHGWRDKREAQRATIGLLALIGIGIVGASHLVKDNGFAIIALPIVVASLAAYFGRAAITGWAADASAATAAAVALLIVLLLWVGGFAGGTVALTAFGVVGLLALALWIARPGVGWLAPAVTVAGLLIAVNLVAAFGPVSGAHVDLDQALRADTNKLRLFAALAPSRLIEVGTRNADALQDTVEHMRDYGRTLFGRGYFTLPVPTVLKPYHMTDNLSAVHLISPFGRLGAFALLLVPGSLAIAAVVRALGGGGRSPTAAWLGALAALSLALVSTYMVLANLLAAPFTGRNVYLLAAPSSSDLVEGLMLAALVMATLASAKPTLPEAEAQAGEATP